MFLAYDPAGKLIFYLSQRGRRLLLFYSHFSKRAVASEKLNAPIVSMKRRAFIVWKSDILITAFESRYVIIRLYALSRRLILD